MKPFLPSDVSLAPPIPLCDTMGRVEREFAAALIVRTLQKNGNGWTPVTMAMMLKSLREELAAEIEPWTSLNTNPFYRPDFYDLVNAGYARSAWVDGASEYEFTEKGLQALSKYVDSSKDS